MRLRVAAGHAKYPRRLGAWRPKAADVDGPLTREGRAPARPKVVDAAAQERGPPVVVDAGVRPSREWLTRKRGL